MLAIALPSSANTVADLPLSGPRSRKGCSSTSKFVLILPSTRSLEHTHTCFMLSAFTTMSYLCHQPLTIHERIVALLFISNTFCDSSSVNVAFRQVRLLVTYKYIVFKFYTSREKWRFDVRVSHISGMMKGIGLSDYSSRVLRASKFLEIIRSTHPTKLSLRRCSWHFGESCVFMTRSMSHYNESLSIE